MHTSGMKLTSLFLSLMLAGSALGAPVPANNVPGVNPPTLGSGVVEGAAPGAMDKVNTGLKGDIKPPQDKPDPIAAATDAAADGNAEPAKGLGARQIPDPAAALGGADLDALLAALGGATKRSAGPPSIDPTGIRTEIHDAATRGHKRSAGPPSIDPTGIRTEIHDAATRGHKRSYADAAPEEGVPVDEDVDVDVAAILAKFLEDGDVGAESLDERSPVDPQELIDGVKVGKNADVPTPADVTTIAKGATGKREVECVKKFDAKGNSIGCVSDAVGEKIDLNKLNGVDGAATGKTQPPKTGAETVTGHDASDAISTFASGVRARDNKGTEAVGDAVHLADEGKKIVGGGDVASVTTPLGGKKVPV